MDCIKQERRRTPKARRNGGVSTWGSYKRNFEGGSLSLTACLPGLTALSSSLSLSLPPSLTVIRSSVNLPSIPIGQDLCSHFISFKPLFLGTLLASKCLWQSGKKKKKQRMMCPSVCIVLEHQLKRSVLRTHVQREGLAKGFVLVKGHVLILVRNKITSIY